MSTAASGMEAQELRMDLLAHNLSNVNTTGFKKSRAEFQDVLYETIRAPGSENANGEGAPTGLQVGQGVRVAATLRSFSMGDLKQTGNPLDLAIEGGGFFQVSRPDGTLAYSRDGSLKTNAEGILTTSDGLPLEPNLILPPDTRQVTIAADGTVSVLQAGQTSPVQVGQITLASFANPSGLEPIGRNLYLATPIAGDPVVAIPGSEGAGALSQGFLEMSNVKVIDEMIELIATQRAYETGSKVIQAADEMLRSTANLR